ncbi:hypothetical protein MKW92_032289 [Papaver armeniacum]|nr:hypothetical protein MKW92_032289 [Papaver armeniacum]
MILQKLINGLLSIYFFFLSIQIPLFNGQTILPIEIFPKFLVELVSKYARDNNDYLISDKPRFFIGIVWAELLLQWPLLHVAMEINKCTYTLCTANFFGIVKKRSWVKKTCLVYGISAGSLKLVGIFYVPFMVVAVICILNGLTTTSSSVNRTARDSTEEGAVHLF